MMIETGLVPASTGKKGGKATGRRMTHSIRADGPFDQLCSELLNSGFVIPYVETELSYQLAPTLNPDDPQARESIDLLKQKAERLRRKKVASKSRYTCPSCDDPPIHVWGKPELHIICGKCGAPFEMDNADEGLFSPEELPLVQRDEDTLEYQVEDEAHEPSS
jgi:hypothetical protein